MANDHIQFSVHCTPIEELAQEEGSDTTSILASEVGTSLGGNGDSVDLANYSGAASTQGYANAAVNYLDMTHSAGGTQIRSGGTDFIFIKNTGFKFSSATVLGASTTDCILVVIKSPAHNSGSDGGFQTSGDADQDHFYEVAWLQAGQGIVLPLGASKNSITQFGSNANDLSSVGQTSSSGQARVFGMTFQSDGSAATDGNSLEYLAVT